MAELFDHWALRLASDYREAVGRLPLTMRQEARLLAARVRRLAPVDSRRLQNSIRETEAAVTSDVPYAEIQDQGGVITARQHGWLTIPVRRGYRPAPGFVTLRSRDGNQIVVRSGTRELWAIRRREVRIKGSRYLERALEGHLEEAGGRVLATLPDVGKGGSRGG